MRRGPKLEPIVLTAEENNRLLEWTRRHKTSQALAMRARVVLACQQDRPNREIARQLHITTQTVGKWRKRFQQLRLEGLLDEPRPGAPRTISDEQVERVIAKTLHETPREATHWSSRMMAKATGLSQTGVMRIWHAFGLQPHRTETFKLSTDPLFIEKMRDIVGLYLNPPDRALVPRFHAHFTPTSSSWLNQVGRWFATLTERQIRRGTHRSTVELEQAIRDYLAANNRNPRPFVWTKTTDQILESIKRFCMRTSNSGH